MGAMFLILLALLYFAGPQLRNSILSLLWETFVEMIPVFIIIGIIGIPLVSIMAWLSSKQPKPPRCPHCDQVLPAEKQHLATEKQTPTTT